MTALTQTGALGGGRSTNGVGPEGRVPAWNGGFVMPLGALGGAEARFEAMPFPSLICRVCGLRFRFRHARLYLLPFFFSQVPWGASWTLRRKRSAGQAVRPGNRRVLRPNSPDSCLQVRVRPGLLPSPTPLSSSLGFAPHFHLYHIFLCF